MPDLTIPSTSTPGLTSPAPRPALSEEAELEQFIATHDLRADLDKAIAILRESFPEASQVVVRLQYLPDDDEMRVIVDARMSAGVADASERYWQMLDRWIRELPPRARDILVADYTRS
jgi:hypothetical protein